MTFSEWCGNMGSGERIVKEEEEGNFIKWQ